MQCPRFWQLNPLKPRSHWVRCGEIKVYHDTWNICDKIVNVSIAYDWSRVKWTTDWLFYGFTNGEPIYPHVCRNRDILFVYYIKCVYIYIYLHTFALHTYIVIPQKIEKSIPISQMTIHKHCHLFIAYCNYTCDRMSIPTRTINHYTWCRSYLIFTYMNIYIYGCTYVMSTIYV